MVRVTRNSKTSDRVAGCSQSPHSLIPPTSSSPVPCVTGGPVSMSAVDREKARADARQSKKGAEVKAKGRYCVSRNGNISIPAAELLNELPVRVRQEVETIKSCCMPCLPGSHRPSYATPQFLAVNLHKHQLFSKDHEENLDPEIRQWLPRLVCPAFPISARCRGQGQRCDAMLRHLETCKPFRALFPDEHRRLFPRPNDPKPPSDDEYKLLKMTLGQLVFLSAKLGKAWKGSNYSLVKLSTTTIWMVLHSWRPFSKPDAEVIHPSEFPPVRIPEYFYAGATTEDEREHDGLSGYDGDFDTGSSSIASGSSPIRMPVDMPNEEMQQDAPTPSSSLSSLPTPTSAPEPIYPDLYLPPHLLPSTCDPSYLMAAIAAHTPEIDDAFSPLLNVPISLLSAAEVPRESAVSEYYDPALFSFEGAANDPTREFNRIFDSCDRMLETPLFSQKPAESGLVTSQVSAA